MIYCKVILSPVDNGTSITILPTLSKNADIYLKHAAGKASFCLEFIEAMRFSYIPVCYYGYSTDKENKVVNEFCGINREQGNLIYGDGIIVTSDEQGTRNLTYEEAWELIAKIYPAIATNVGTIEFPKL